METVITLLVVGTLLVLLETVLPGMIAGIVGFASLVAGVVVAYRNFGPVVGGRVLFGVVVGLLAAGALWIRFFPNSRWGRMFVTRQAVGSLGVERPELVNQTGTTLTILRPSGTASINGQRVDVVSEGVHVECGTPVRVVAVEGLRVVVRAC